MFYMNFFLNLNSVVDVSNSFPYLQIFLSVCLVSGLVLVFGILSVVIHWQHRKKSRKLRKF